MKNLSGTPESTRKDLWGGAGGIALSSFALGLTVDQLFSRPATSTDYIALVVWIALLVTCVIQFRDGLAFVPKQSHNKEQKQPGIEPGG